MSSKQTSTNPERPAVFIHTVTAPDQAVLDPILWGLEEEGIPFRLAQVANAPAAAIAKQAADASPLNVGIGIHNETRTVCLHHRDLRQDQPLFTLRTDPVGSSQLRRLGMNAARLVKGDPLVSEDRGRPPEAIQQSSDPDPIQADALVDLIAGIVTEIIRKP